MATTQTMPIGQEGQPRRRLRNFMRRLAKRRPSPEPVTATNPGSGRTPVPLHRRQADNTARTSLEAAHSAVQPPSSTRIQRLSQSLSDLSKAHSQQSLSVSAGEPDENEHRPAGARSIAPTIATQPGTTHSDARSKTGTFTTGGGALSTHELGGEGSTFSSPAPSVRSLTTTLTTIQSTAPGNLLNHHQPPQSSTSTHFSHQFPTTPTPASAIPPHVAGGLHGSSHPHTYSTATANNVLTDDASIVTLASSTKRRRRNSLDTNASVRALAPSSVFGGSRESLPLSVLSGNLSLQEQRETQAPGTASGAASMVGSHAVGRPNLVGTAAAERASVYSGSGIIAGTSNEGRETRSSYYANRAGADGASIRSGLLGHGRNDSITGSIGGQASPLASPTVAEEK